MYRKIVTLSILLVLSRFLMAQTDYTSHITNPSFETNNNDGWTWTGVDGYAWVGPNNDGDVTKDGIYINGLWNSSIGDAECSQVINDLPNGFYKITALLTVSTGRTTNQRLFAKNATSTKSILYGSYTNPAYTTENLAILGSTENYSYGNHGESGAENGPFYAVSVFQAVENESLTIGIRVSGKSNAEGFDFSHTTRSDAGFFKFDHFTITEVSDVARLQNISLSSGFLDSPFDPEKFSYTATLPAGTSTVSPYIIPSVEGTTITGVEAVDVSSGSGSSQITVSSLDGSKTANYTILYIVDELPADGQQEKLYTNEFPLGSITLLDGPFKHAMDLNIETLLQYDVDRLLAPYRKEAGLPEKAISYSNWIGLDGHIGGHYLSAMAIHYAATGNSTCKANMEYMLSELKACQDAHSANSPSWATGYVGGVPSSASIWLTFKTGNFSAYNASWVPWYNLHKTFAGLRDAWLYGENETAKSMFLDFCDWAIDITSALSDSQMEIMLATEHGGMNEVLADAYQMTGDAKYMDAAKRFSHKLILNSMAASIDNLDNMHANTQVPKAVGIQRIAELSKDASYRNAASYFWQTVTGNRSLALGGNSRKEYFPEASASGDYIIDVEGPESCNTNNMLKLTEHLFRTDPRAEYADFYERALYNHILSTQHPEHGGYVYFTPARPQHYRVYSAPNQAMWCCVGTGMENHGKYGEFIYTRNADSLYLNLFIASELNWEEKAIQIRQETEYPEEELSRLFISASSTTDFTLMVRAPGWLAAGSMKIYVNGLEQDIPAITQGYVGIERSWNDGDSVRIELPMENRIEELPYLSNYIAFMHGPVLLGAKTGTQDLTGLVADDSRWGHIASGSLQALDKAPIVIGEQDSLKSKIQKVEGEKLHFTINEPLFDSIDREIVLEPFYKIHDSRYMMYWLNLNEDQYAEYLDSLALVQEALLELEARTVDKVAPGEQQPEADHDYQGVNSYSGSWQNEFWRDARDGGYISYTFSTGGLKDLSLMVRYWGNEAGNRTFNILIDNILLTTENIVGKWNVSEFINVEYPIPDSLTDGKDEIRVTFEAINSSNMAGGLFFVRILKPEGNNEIESPSVITGLEASAIGRDIYLHWDSASKASSYVIHRAIGDILQFDSLTTVADTFYIDYDLYEGESYTYTITALNAKGYGEESNPVTITLTSIATTLSTGDLLVYPNPFSEEVSVSFMGTEELPCQLELYHISGSLVYKSEILARNQLLKLPDLKPGIYLLKLKMQDRILLKQLIKN